MKFRREVKFNNALRICYQGTITEKIAAQKPNQGVCTDVLKPTKEVREGNKKQT